MLLWCIEYMYCKRVSFAAPLFPLNLVTLIKFFTILAKKSIFRFIKKEEQNQTKSPVAISYID